MAHLGFSINREDLPTQDDYGLIPEGNYSAQTIEAHLKDTKSGGQRIELVYSIMGPTHAGRRIYQSFNVRNANPKAEEIAYKQLNEFMTAAGIAAVEDTDQMVGYSVQLAIKIKKDAEYGDKNEVKRVSSLAASAAEPALAPTQTYSAPAAQAAPAQAPARNTPPWKR